MDNERLINEARHLYAVLQVEQLVQSIKNKAGVKRLDRAVLGAYCRYQRRLNRCVLCYTVRLDDCSREFEEKERRFCPMRTKLSLGRCNKEGYYAKKKL